MARTKSIETYDNEIKKVKEQIITTEAQLQNLVDNRKDYQADIIRAEFIDGKRSFEEAMNFFKCPGK